jgi:putative membrane protein
MDRRQLLAGGAALAAALPVAHAARAQEGGMDEAKIAALEGGMFLMMTSQIAMERGESDAVRVFAELETAEQQAIASAFGAEGAEIPLREDHQAIVDQLNGLEGAEFDAAYLDAQITGHEEARPIHEDYAANGEDPMARGASMVGVPSIDSHLVMLRSFREQAGG